MPAITGRCHVCALAVTFVTGAVPGIAQQTLLHSESAQRTFRLNAGNVAYAVGLTQHGSVQMVYWGARLAANDPLPSAEPAVTSTPIWETGIPPAALPALKPLIDHVHALGMDFGLWVEPEM